jgi:hypothetical protein
MLAFYLIEACLKMISLPLNSGYSVLANAIKVAARRRDLGRRVAWSVSDRWRLVADEDAVAECVRAKRMAER